MEKNEKPKKKFLKSLLSMMKKKNSQWHENSSKKVEK